MGNLSTPKTVQKLRKALHAKAKAEAGYRFYALYDKISREDILAYAFAQCRSNKGAPGVDGQDFADIETYGVERWLGELALALREESYQPDPIRRVFIPKANGKLRPLGIFDRAGFRSKAASVYSAICPAPCRHLCAGILIIPDGPITHSESAKALIQAMCPSFCRTTMRHGTRPQGHVLI